MVNYYLAIGDSITAGYGVNGKSFAFWYYVACLKSIDPCMSYINYGINGLTTGQLKNRLLYDGSLIHLVRNAGIITLTIGSNDLLQFARTALQGGGGNAAATLGMMAENCAAIGSRFRMLNPVAPVKVGTIYNPLPAGPLYDTLGSAQSLISQANKIIIGCAKRNGFIVVPVDKLFRGKEPALIGPDHLHPNLMGQELMAAGFCA